jgi:hypothetical protein
MRDIKIVPLQSVPRGHGGRACVTVEGKEISRGPPEKIFAAAPENDVFGTALKIDAP